MWEGDCDMLYYRFIKRTFFKINKLHKGLIAKNFGVSFLMKILLVIDNGVILIWVYMLLVAGVHNKTVRFFKVSTLDIIMEIFKHR